MRESRLRRGSGDDATYLLLGMLTMVMPGEGDDDTGDDATLSTGLLEIGIDELRLLLPSNDMLRQLWTESGRVRLESFLVMDEGPLDLRYRLPVLFVRLLLDGGPVVGVRPLGGFATKPFVPGNGILLGLLRFGVSGHFDSCWSCADSVELLCWKASSIGSGIIAFMLGVEMVWECFGVDVCMMVMPSCDETRD